jgi:adenylate cyclase
MTQEGFKRKLAAILSAAVSGYSILIDDDETITIRNLKAYRDIVSNIIGQHNGRVVDSTGDNILAEFSSVVNAVQCAVEIQKQLKKENDRLVEDRQLKFRMGVNIGDVVQYHYQKDGHWNPKGHRRAANEIIRFLETSDIF